MDPENIYPKESRPFLARSRPPDHPPPPSVPLHPRVASLDGGRPHRRRRRRRDNQRTSSYYVWIGLALLVVAYFGALFYFHFKHPLQRSRAAATTPEAPAAPRPEKPPAAPLDDRSAEELRKELVDKIRTWKAAEDAVDAAVLLERSGKFDEAVSRLRSALELAPNHADAQALLGSLLFQQRKLREAESLLVNVLSMDPSRLTERMILANVFSAEKQPAAALAIAQWMLESDAYSMDAHALAGQAYDALDDPAAADHWKKVVAVQRDNVPALNALARAYTKMGRFAEAVETLKNVIQTDPKNSSSYFNLAVAYTRHRDVDLAIDVLGDAAALFGNTFVESWTKASDFDSVRTNESFVNFQAELGIPGTFTRPADELETNPAPSVIETTTH